MARGKKSRAKSGGNKGKNGAKNGAGKGVRVGKGKRVRVGKIKTKDMNPSKIQKRDAKITKENDDSATSSQPKRSEINYLKSATKFECTRCGFSEYVDMEEGRKHDCKMPPPTIKSDKKSNKK